MFFVLFLDENIFVVFTYFYLHTYTPITSSPIFRPWQGLPGLDLDLEGGQITDDYDDLSLDFDDANSEIDMYSTCSGSSGTSLASSQMQIGSQGYVGSEGFVKSYIGADDSETANEEEVGAQTVDIFFSLIINYPPFSVHYIFFFVVVSTLSLFLFPAYSF
jgi:hypothetical protein